MKHAHWQLIWVVLLTATLAGIGATILLKGRVQPSSEPEKREEFKTPETPVQSSFLEPSSVFSINLG